MTIMALADCCRQLAIDPKTLRRWLAQAQLTLQPHPGDARLKGITAEQLHLLATAHHRSLPTLSEERPTSAPIEAAPPSSPLPPQLLDLLQQLRALPGEIAALQQQLAALKERLEQPPVTASQAHQGALRRGHPSPAIAVAPSRPSAPPRPQPPAHVLPRVEYGSEGHYVVICPKHGLLPLAPDTPEWFAWLATQSSFRFVGKGGRLTAHHEWRVPRGAWRAHRHIRNRSYTLRLALTQDLTIAVLEQAAAALQAHLT
jgi:transposase-like protein